ncbi:DegV family protein [Thermophilibacter provencensis]|uniref:DegV family protein n=1 Tax=Thermophilibacter provencensis TaxID=1852386 RepID=A0ABT7V3G2_9ACTN|nr:DegV family protein [Thermophilibacter provencensis]MDM8271129.1 DegV family protein [Thermophilibacter provencensis]
MPDYVLSCCSTADVTREWLEGRDIKYLYFNYYLNGEMCKDDFGTTNSPAQLYAKMLAGADAKTSQISAGDYMAHFEKYLAAGKDVLHVTLSTGISGTYNSACTARDQLAEKYPERKVIVIDSLAASSGFGLLMDKLAELRDAGMGIDELAAWAEEHKSEVQHWFFSSDLTFFVRGGRVSKAAGLVGGMLKICPVMDVEPDGSLAVKEKIRTKAKAVSRVVQKMEELAEGGLDYSGKCYISQSECIDDAQEVARLVEQKFPKLNGKVEIFPIGATIGVHTGPGTVALFFWGKKRA